MMFFWLKKLIVVFSTFIAAVFLYELLMSFPSRSSYSKKLFQELWTRKNYPFLSTKDATEIAQEPDEQLIIFITSAPFHIERRLSIRQTWLSLLVNNTIARGRSSIRTMKNPSNSSNNLVIHYWFVCGHDTKVEVESAVRNESAVYGDILRLNYTETYSLLAFKTMSSLWLASTMDVQFIVKVDDDVYLHVPKMIWWLKTSSLPENLYAGCVQYGAKVIRNPTHKWFVSEQFLNDSWFPPYCGGPFYILSKSALLELLKVSLNEGLTPFPLEDAYIGILAKRVGIAPLQLNGKHVLITGPSVGIGLEDKKLNDFFALGHGLSIERMFKLHERFFNLTLI